MDSYLPKSYPSLMEGKKILYVHGFLLQALQLRLAVFKIALFLQIDQIIITGGRHHRNLHPRFYTTF